MIKSKDIPLLPPRRNNLSKPINYFKVPQENLYYAVYLVSILDGDHKSLGRDFSDNITDLISHFSSGRKKGQNYTNKDFTIFN